MNFEAFHKLYPLEGQVCCLECQFLHQPNPEEENVICLRTLLEVVHEIDYEIDCWGFRQIDSFWAPVYVASEDAFY